jgi:Protein of unknown function (DUF3141)
VRFEVFSDKNPWLRPLAGLAEIVRANRQPAAANNPFLVLQDAVSERIVEALDWYRDQRDQAVEAFFTSFYGSPMVQAAVGMRSDLAAGRWRIGRDVARETAEAQNRAGLALRIEQGGLPEAVIRGLLYIGRGASHMSVDERVFATLRQLRQSHPEYRGIDLGRFKEIVRSQYLTLLYDEEAAVAAIPRLLPSDPAQRRAAFAAIRQAAEAGDDLSEEAQRRLSRIEALFTREVLVPTASNGGGGPVVTVRRRVAEPAADAKRSDAIQPEPEAKAARRAKTAASSDQGTET